MSDQREVDINLLRLTLLSEIENGEVRARRSLRVLEHQEGRISALENDLGGKSNMLRELRESHANLLEVHRHQEEVQTLQRELIKMQEIQYLAEVTQPKVDQNDNKKDFEEKAQQTFPSSSAATAADPITKSKDGNGKSAENSTTEQDGALLFPPSRRSADKEDETCATDNAILRQHQKKKANSIRINSSSLESSLWKMGSLLQSDQQQKENSTAENNKGIHYLDEGKSGTKEAEEDVDEDSVKSQKLPTGDDDDEQIYILKETLSSHRQSIEDLSSEVMLLRREKGELLSYVHSLMDWKSKVEHILEEFGIPRNITAAEEVKVESKREIDVIMKPAAEAVMTPEERARVPPQKRLSSMSLLSVKTDEECDNHVQERCTSRHVGWNLNTETDTDEIGSVGTSGSGTKLEVRARRLWETACRFFTPQQAHFILTAPIPPDQEDEEEEDTVAWMYAFAEHERGWKQENVM